MLSYLDDLAARSRDGENCFLFCYMWPAAAGSLDIFLLQRPSCATELGDELTPDTVDETQILSDQLAHALPFAVVYVSRDNIDLTRGQAVVEQVASCIVATASDAKSSLSGLLLIGD